MTTQTRSVVTPTVNLPPVAPDRRFFFGHGPAFNGDTLNYLLKVRQYGDLVKLYFGPIPAYVASHPQYAQAILVAQAEHFIKPRFFTAQLDDSVGKGLFTSDGELWKRQRKLIAPSFHTRRIANYADIMTDYAQRSGQQWADGAVLDVEAAMARLTMQIVTKAMFAVEVDGETDTLSHAITTILGTTNTRTQRAFQVPRWLPTAENRAMKQAVRILDEAISHFVAERRKSSEDKGDLLKMLMDATDEQGGGMSDKQLRDEVATVFGAGHETTANTLTWTWYLLSQHPQVEAKLHEELDRVLGGRVPALDDLAQLPYTERVIKEAMRLYPPAWGVSREAMHPVAVGDYELEGGSISFINIWGMHRDERFFPQAETFDPDRFSPEREADIPRYAYLPFGSGPRICVGNAFAMMEARLVLATLAQRFRLRLAEGQVVEPMRFFVLRPKYGMRMRVERR